MTLSFFCLFPLRAQDREPQADTARIEEQTRDGVFGPGQFNFISWQDNMMGASPEAARMTRYADTPMSYAYGQAEIGIPIYTITSRSLRLPIALSYDCTGIKPGEVSGIVGLGWALQAGGVITRTIIGRKDNIEFEPEITDESRAEILAIWANSGQDTEYDRYSYSFCGHSGSFYVIPWVGIVPAEPTELKIEEVSNGYLITDTDGTQYLFSRTESSGRYMSGSVNAPLVNNSGTYYGVDTITAWHLTEIRSMDGKDVISLTYHEIPHFNHSNRSYYRSISFQYRYMGNDVWQTIQDSGGDTSFQTREWFYDTIYECSPWVIDSIAYNGGGVKFNYLNEETRSDARSYSRLLSKITVRDSGNTTLFSWDFSLAPTGDQRWLLSSVEMKDRVGSTVESWSMEYDSPDTYMSKTEIDIFGYYNGGGYGSTAFLRPFNDEYTVPFGVSNRRHNSAYARKLSLTSITTASGSRTRFSYAPNAIPSGGYSNLAIFSDYIEIGQRISSIRTYDLSGLTERLVRKRTFTYEQPGITIPLYAFQMGAFISTREYNSYTTGMQVGHWYGPLSPIRTCHIVYGDQSNLPGAPLESARIFYGKVTEEVSDGSLPLTRTVWEYNASGAVSNGGGGPVWTNSDAHDNQYTYPSCIRNHFHQRVPVYIPRSGSQSYPHNVLGYHIQDQNRPQLANPVAVTSYKRLADGTFTPVSKTSFAYDTAEKYLQVGMVLCDKRSLNGYGYENTSVHCLSDVDQQQVDRKIIYQRLRQREDKEYLDDGTVKSVKTTYHYDYYPYPYPYGRTSFYSGNTYSSVEIQVPDMGAIQAPREEVTVYDNDASRTYRHCVIYPDELVGISGCGWADSLLTRGYRRPVGEELLVGAAPLQNNKAGRYVSWAHIPVASWSSGVTNQTVFKPHLIEVRRNGAAVGPDVTFSLYDSFGCPMEIQAQGQPTKTYAWGYNHRYPLAEVVGKSFSQTRGAMSQQQKSMMNYIAGMDSFHDHYLTIVRNALRTAQSNALTTIHTYNPPFGITREEDPSGRAVLYEYDSAGRLAVVKDEDGNKITEYSYSFSSCGFMSPNSIKTRTYTSGGSSLSGTYLDNVYYDGLGRTLQMVQEGAATSAWDLVTPYEPDFLGREDVKEYLPYKAITNAYTQGKYRGDAITAQQNYYGEGVKAYKENTYESSTRNRITGSSLPGFTEQTTELTYGSPQGLVLKLSYNPSDNTVSADGYYPANRFKVTAVDGPDGSRSESFGDEFESPYLQRTKQDTLGTYADTYYIRDAIGRVVCVVPPEEAAQLTPDTTGFSAVNCYTYVYDGRGRVTKKRLPGRATEEFDYNDADLVTSHRRLSLDSLADEEFTTTYDAFNRTIKEQYRYGNNTPVTIAEYYYDAYPNDVPAFTSESGYALNPDTRVRGLKTAESIALLPPVAGSILNTDNTSNGVTRAFYYDAKGNVILQAEQQGAGASCYTFSNYGFAGNLLSQRQKVQPASGASVITLDKTYAYDVRLRPTGVTAQLSGGPQASMTYTYDDMQRVAGVNRGNDVENTQYAFTIQGWLQSALSTSWNEWLYYEAPSLATTDPLPGKAGLVTDWVQKSNTTTFGFPTYPNIYSMSYDKAGRFIGSRQKPALPPAGQNVFTERDITYDRNGNLLSLKRYGGVANAAPIDSLSFTYNGPKRVGYSYDANGNVTNDPENGTSINWNILDLPRSISKGTASTQRYYYADGTLARIMCGNSTRAYIGDMVFRLSPGGTSLESAGWDGGLLLPGTGSDKILYSLTDHLGSVRVIKDGSGAYRQYYEYYPYGSVSRSWSSSGTADTADKRYRFGGKEIAGSTSNAIAAASSTYLDFGARLYDPRTAMWMSQDPMSESYYSIGPQVYCAGNPVNVVDPEGLSPIYDLCGQFLGVDDYGLQGEPIFMEGIHYYAGMKHEEALSFNIPWIFNSFSDSDKLRFMIHYVGLRSRPDWDGVITINEGIAWAKAHPGAAKNQTPDNTLYADAAKLDFGVLTIADIGGGKKTVNLYNFKNTVRAFSNKTLARTVYALGKVEMEIENKEAKTISIVTGESTIYDWDLHGTLKRKVPVLFERGRSNLNDTHGFQVVYYGVGHLKK